MRKLFHKIKHTGRQIGRRQRVMLFALVIVFLVFLVIGLLYIKDDESKEKNENPNSSPWLNKSCLIDLGRQECKYLGKEFLSAEINQFLFYSGTFTCSNDSSSWIYIKITKEEIGNCSINTS